MKIQEHGQQTGNSASFLILIISHGAVSWLSAHDTLDEAKDEIASRKQEGQDGDVEHFVVIPTVYWEDNWDDEPVTQEAGANG